MKTSSLIYGPSGSGKSSFIEMLLRKLLQPGEKARIATAEHYGAYQEVIDEGLAEVWHFSNRSHPFENSRAVAKAYWPEDNEDGVFGQDPTSKLVPFSLELAAKYPVRIYEGIGTTAAYITSNHLEGGLLERAGKGDVIGPVMEHIQFMDGAEGVGGLCWTHYRIGQMEMMGLVQTTQKWPGRTIWTSHEDDGKDRGVPFVGPEVIGSKVTGTIGREFDNLWHLIGVPVDVDTTDGLRRLVDRRLYVKEHIYPGGTTPCKGKNSAGLSKQKELPDYFSLSKNGLPDLEAVDRILGKIKC